jgi:hypothetical protein
MFCDGLRMRIDASNLIIAAQAPAHQARATKTAEQTGFEPLTFPKAEPTPERTRQITPLGISQPLGTQLDIKI